MSIKLNKIFIVVYLTIMVYFSIVLIQFTPQVKANELIPTLYIEEDVNRNGKFYTKLDGEWLFYEKELLIPEQFEHDSLGKRVTIPTDFKTITGEVNDYGTFVVNVKISEKLVGEKFAIHIPYQYSAYKLYVNNDLIASNGTVGTDADTHKSEMAPRTAYFTPDINEFMLTMQLSSFEHIRGGFENSILIGESKVLTDIRDSNMIVSTFINGFIFIIGIFMVLFALYRRKEYLFLIFGIFSILISIRSFFTVPFYYTILFPNMSWVWGTRWEYVLTLASSLFFILLMWKWHEKQFSKILLYFLTLLHVSLIIVTFFTQPVVFQNLFFKSFYLAIPVFLYFIYLLSNSLRENNKTAKVNLIGISIIFAAALNDFAIGQGWYKSWNLILVAVGIYIIMHVVSMSRDFAQSFFQIEEQNRQLRELNDSNELLANQLQQEIKLKDDFLANTSHELRNPLHSIINIGHSILLHKQDVIDDEIEDEIKLQVSIGHHMSRTLDDLLDITRIKEHRIKLEQTPLHLGNIVFAVVDMLNVLIENKDVTISIEIDEYVPSVYADKNRLIQILFNLLHNALKYTIKGSITIRAYEENNFVKVEIEDTGIGMDEAFLEKVFLPYQQSDSSITAVGGGLGLGLNISKNLVELHGGSISVQSTKDEGSTFTFTLPLADESATTDISIEEMFESHDEVIESDTTVGLHKMIENLAEKQIGTARPRILVIDDDPVNLKVITNILSKSYYDIRTVTSGEEALFLLENNDWDLVISDVMMPSISGYEITKQVRKKHSISELPIILITARNNPDDIYTGFLVGANDYLIKPIDAMELIVRVSALTNLQASIDERLQMEAAWLQAQIKPHFLFNTLNTIISLSQIDTERMNKLLEHFTNYLRSSFQFKNIEKIVPLKDELKLVKSYAYIQQERFGDRLHINWELEETDFVLIPPLSLQTIVENAIHHGVLQKPEGGTVTIRAQKGPNGIEISVTDDGVGMDHEQVKQVLIAKPDKKRGIGLINTELRLQNQFGTGLKIVSKKNVGTKISFVVPNVNR